MARTLWPMYSVVCIKGFSEFPFSLCDRVIEDQKSAIAIYNLLTFRVEWAFLEDLEYLDIPEKRMEYYNAVQRENSKSIRRIKKPSVVHTGGSIKESKREQISGSQST